MPTIIERKLNLFEHMCRMNGNRLIIKTTVFGNDEWNIKKRVTSAGREWLDDVRHTHGARSNEVERSCESCM